MLLATLLLLLAAPLLRSATLRLGLRALAFVGVSVATVRLGLRLFAFVGTISPARATASRRALSRRTTEIGLR